MTINILKIESFQPLGPAKPRAEKPAPEAVQIKPGIWQLPDGRLETRDPVKDLTVNGGYGGKPAPRKVPNALGGDWIEWHGGECPIPEAGLGEYAIRFKNGFEPNTVLRLEARHWSWHKGEGYSIIAYRLLPKEPA